MSNLNSTQTARAIPHFIIGRDTRDRWVVMETHGFCGGLFCNEAAAIRYAREESQGRACTIEITERPLVLKVG